MLPWNNIKHDMVVDSKALFDIITTLHNIREFILQKSVSRLRASFEAEETDTARWVPGNLNLADAFTNRNVQLSRQLNQLMKSRLWTIRFTESHVHESENWR